MKTNMENKIEFIFTTFDVYAYLGDCGPRICHHLGIFKQVYWCRSHIAFTKQRALIWACGDGHLDLVKHMVNVGCDLEIKFNFETPMEYSFFFGHVPVIEYLFSLGAKITKLCIHNSIFWNRVDAFKWVVSKKLPTPDLFKKTSASVKSACKILLLWTDDTFMFNNVLKSYLKSVEIFKHLHLNFEMNNNHVRRKLIKGNQNIKPNKNKLNKNV